MGPDLEVRGDEELQAQAAAVGEGSSPPVRPRLRRIKESIQAAATNTLEAQLGVERDFMAELGRSKDYREGVAAFMAKRAPNFTGE